jgi:hypothetical protein
MGARFVRGGLFLAVFRFLFWYFLAPNKLPNDLRRRFVSDDFCFGISILS